MKRGCQFSFILFCAVFASLGLVGCGSGGTDTPFVFPSESNVENPCTSVSDCTTGQVCVQGTCAEPSGNLPPPIDCSVAGCPGGQFCNPQTKVCENPKPTCSSVTCGATETCNPTTVKCECDPAKDPNKCQPAPPKDCTTGLTCPADQQCNLQTKVCETIKPTCSSVTCGATETCNPATVKCECDPAKDPNKCQLAPPKDCTNGLTCPTDQQCNLQTKQCEPKPPVVCNPTCTADQVCNNGKCETKPPVTCDPACTADQVCNNGKCEAKPPVACNPVCTADQVCNNGKCEAKPPVVCDPACTSDQVCNNGKCEAKPPVVCNPACTVDQVCNNGKCEAKPPVVCDPACVVNEICNNGKCECDPAKDPNKCQPVPACQDNTGCTEGKVCLTGQCVACSDNTQCGANQKCDAGKCVVLECSNDTQCQDKGTKKVCDVTKGACVVCTAQEGCQAGQLCNAVGQCVSPQKCTPECGVGQHCDALGGSCVACLIDQHCGAGEICQAGSCTKVSTCSKDQKCAAGQICLGGTCLAAQCSDDASCGTGKVCQQGVCIPKADQCALDFKPSLILRGDGANDFRDIPAECYKTFDDGSYYFDPATGLGPEGSGFELDLHCCKEAVQFSSDMNKNSMIPDVTGKDQLSCVVGSNPDQTYTGKLAVTSWAPNYLNDKSGKPLTAMSLTVKNITKNPAGDYSCELSFDPKEFPYYKLENTGLEASLLISSGALDKDEGPLFLSYQQHHLNAKFPTLNEATIKAPCRITTDAQGNIIGLSVGEKLGESGLPMRFFAGVYTSEALCVAQAKTPAEQAKCPSFTKPHLAPAGQNPKLTTDKDSMILPGFKFAPFQLTTGISTIGDQFGQANVVSPQSVKGRALSFDAVKQKSILRLVTAFQLPNSSKTTRCPSFDINDEANTTDQCDVEGTGKILAQLKGALLSATLEGEVTIPSGANQSVKKIDDLLFCGLPQPECLVDDTCPNGKVCGSGGKCVAAATLECSSVAACGNGQVCVGAKCQACVQDGQCDTGQVCDLDKKVCKLAASTCDPSKSDCCLVTSDCKAANQGKVCANEQCVACTQDSQCGNGKVCDLIKGLCGDVIIVKPECTTNANCQGGQVCKNEKCVSCTANADCTPPQECGATGLCQDPPPPKEFLPAVHSGDVSPLTEIKNSASDPKGSFAGQVCLLGLEAGGKCLFAADSIPFYKTVGKTYDATLTSRFEKTSSLVIDNKSQVTPLNLKFPAVAGAFHLDDCPILIDPVTGIFTLAPGAQVKCTVRFAPETASGCQDSADGSTKSCQSDLILSDDPNFKITLISSAKKPQGELRVYQLASDGKPMFPALVPAISGGNSVVPFGETTVGGGTNSIAFGFTNNGVETLKLTPQLLDNLRNFRLSHWYQGASIFDAKLVSGKTFTINPLPDSNFGFFAYVNYGPFGKVEDPRADKANLNLDLETQASVLVLQGTAKNETVATAALYIQDQTKAGLAKDFALSPDLYLAQPVTDTSAQKQLSFSLRQDTQKRDVYLANQGKVSDLPIYSILTTNADGVEFVLDDGVKSCANAAETPCQVIPANSTPVKIGTIQLKTAGQSGYKIRQTVLEIGTTPASAGKKLLYKVVGTSGAPAGLHDLKIHRLMALLSGSINGEDNRTVSSMAHDIAQRAADKGQISAQDVEKYTDRFLIPAVKDASGNPISGISFDPVTGKAIIYPVFTPINKDSLSLFSSKFDGQKATPAIQGLRLFNAPGSTNAAKEKTNMQFLPECVKISEDNKESAASNCSFFFIYLANWNVTGQKSACNNLPPIFSSYNGSGDPQALNPSIPEQEKCMKDELQKVEGGKVAGSVEGLYDPVTGTLTFSNLAVRLFSYQSFAGDIDVVLHLSLTTDVVDGNHLSDSLPVPDKIFPKNTPSIAKELALPVGSQTLQYINENPFKYFIVGENGEPAGPDTGLLHGRPMQQAPQSSVIEDTECAHDGICYDGVKDPQSANPLTFEMAGLAPMKSHYGSLHNKNNMMYLVISLGVGDAK